MRPRFKLNRIASSDKYQESKLQHAEYLRSFHNDHIEEINIISTQIVVKKQKYIRVFEELMPVSEEELKVHNTLITIS